MNVKKWEDTVAEDERELEKLKKDENKQMKVSHHLHLSYYYTVATNLEYSGNSQGVPCNLRENYNKLECGPMPNVMVALPNTGGALCSTPQSMADAHY